MGANKGRGRGRSSWEQNKKHTGTKHSGVKTQDYSKARSRWRLRYIFAARVAKAAILLAVFIAGVMVGTIGLIPVSHAQELTRIVNKPPDAPLVEVVPQTDGTQPQWIVATWLKTVSRDFPGAFQDLERILGASFFFLISLFGMWTALIGLYYVHRRVLCALRLERKDIRASEKSQR